MNRLKIGFAVICMIFFPSCVHAQNNAQQAERIFQQSKVLYETSDYEQAAKLAIQAIKLNPNNPNFWGWLSVYACKADCFEDGLSYVQMGIKRGLGNAGMYENAAFNALQSQEFATARNYFHTALSMGLDKISTAQAKDALKAAGERDFEVTWVFPIKKGQVIPLLASNLYQKASWKLKGTDYTLGLSPTGNPAAFLKSPENQEVTYTVSVHRIPEGYKSLFSKGKILAELPSEIAHYLGESEVIHPHSELTQSILARLPPTNKAEKRAKDISHWLKTHITYKFGLESPTADVTLTRRSGECREFSEAAAQLMRGSGYPCRLVSVMMVPGFVEKGNLLNHVVCEFYLGGLGWVPFDPQDPSTIGCLPNNYIRICSYDDITIHRWDQQALGAEWNTPAFIEK